MHQGQQEQSGSQRHAGPSDSAGHKCPNCGKSFSREDLLRRHMAREARAIAQPSLDRQKSCFECARSKARCDLEVPSCGRCRARGKHCVYAPRSGNPNVRKARAGLSGPIPSHTQEQWRADSVGPSPQPWAPQFYRQNEASTSLPHLQDRSDDESDDSHAASERFMYRDNSSYSISSSESRGSSVLGSPRPSYDQPRAPSMDRGRGSNVDQPPYAFGSSMPFDPTFTVPTRSDSPASFHHDLVSAPSRPDRVYSRGHSINTQVDRSSGVFDNEEGEETPIGRVTSGFQQSQGLDMRMGPPGIPSSSRKPPMPPPLLTGTRMPGPPSTIHKPSLFSAHLDLSGWLDEPVVPSPMYKVGPSFSALGSALGFPLSALKATAPHLDASSTQSVVGTSETETKIPASGLPSVQNARHWWSTAAPNAAGESEALAQLSAAHFITYPALLVLPDATSPVPPFIHRCWLAQLRSSMPRTLAMARVVLAGYGVRLAASEDEVFLALVREIRWITQGLSQLLEAPDHELWAATASLWMYLALCMLVDDPAAAARVDVPLVDEALYALSEMTRSLGPRLRLREEQLAQMDRQDFHAWGFVETIRRTIFASYALLVLQRFREGALNIQASLMGCELVLDVALPASAAEFEAGTEEAWRRERTAPNSIASTSRPTLNDLIKARVDPVAASADLTSYFNGHDEFTNVVLTIALALDAGIAAPPLQQ